jgi:peroxiredoxin
MFKTYVPDVLLHTLERDESILIRKMTSDLFRGKKVLLFGVSGAFVPTCTDKQLPNIERLYDEFIACGFDEVYCTSVNDAFVMDYWAKHVGVKKVKMLPDGNGELAKGLGYLVNKSNLGLSERSWRYAIVIEDCSIERWFEEEGLSDNCPEDPYEVSNPEAVLEALCN